MFSLFSQSENFDQSLLILGYENLRKAYSYSTEYKKMNDSGICSADVTNWLLSKICENPKLYETWSTNRQALSKLAKVPPQQLQEMCAKEPEKVKKLLEFGHEIQKLHEGKPNSRNVENKRFQNDQMSIWLFSLPLISKNNVVEKELDPFFQQGYVFRFYSKEHVIGAFVDLKQRKIFVFDPNDREGEQNFPLGDSKSVYSYLQKRFALIHENLESVSIFLPNTNKHLDLYPIQFQQLKDKIRGGSNDNAHTFFASNSLSILVHALEKFLSENFQQQQNYLKLQDALSVVEQAIKNFNNYTIELDEKFIEHLIESLVTIQNLLPIENSSNNSTQKFVNCISDYLQFFRSFRETFKPNTMSVKLEYLIRNIHIKVSALIKNLKDKPEFKEYSESLQSIIRYANLYGDGSISLENIVTLMALDIDSLIASHEYFAAVLS